MKLGAVVFPLFAILCVTAAQLDGPFRPYFLGGVEITNDVREQSKMDLDFVEIQDLLKNFKFGAARFIYANGKNSKRAGGGKRSFRLLGNTVAPQVDEPLYDLYKQYWQSFGQSGKFARELVDFAFFKKKIFRMTTAKERSQLVRKGIQYHIMLLWVTHSYREALKKCQAGKKNGVGGSQYLVDEAWVYYTGSSEGIVGAGSGYLQYNLADRRCGEFKNTCVGGGPRSKVNQRMINLHNTVKKRMGNGKCATVSGLINNMERAMTIPLIQGLVRYAYLADPAVNPDQEDDQAEGWAFLQAILPQFWKCNRNKARMLRNQMIPTNKNPISMGHIAYIRMMASMYDCLGITCADIGPYSPNGPVIIKACAKP